MPPAEPFAYRAYGLYAAGVYSGRAVLWELYRVGAAGWASYLADHYFQRGKRPDIHLADPDSEFIGKALKNA